MRVIPRGAATYCITYQMLSAEDDSTAMVRMTRGTSVSGCAGAAAVACARAHVAIRAATFCIAHALYATDLWEVALKYGRITEQTQIVLHSIRVSLFLLWFSVLLLLVGK